MFPRPRHRYLWSQWIALSRHERFAHPRQFMTTPDFRRQYAILARVCAELVRWHYGDTRALRRLPASVLRHVSEMLYVGDCMFE